MSSLEGKEIQIVTALSSADLSEKMIGDSCVKELIAAVVNAQKETDSAADALKTARSKKDSSTALRNWWDNTDDTVKDAQLNLSGAVANLNRHSSQLLIFNTAISKVLCDQQDVLLQQQRTLEEQTAQLKQQNRDILTQQKALEEQQVEIVRANQGLLEAKGVSAQQAQNLVGCVKRVEAAEERINELNLTLLNSIDERLERATADIRAALAPALAGLEERDKQLFKVAQSHRRKLEDGNIALASLEERISEQEQALPAEATKREASLIPVNDKLEQLLAQHRNLKSRVVLASVILAVGLLACVGMLGYTLLLNA